MNSITASTGFSVLSLPLKETQSNVNARPNPFAAQIERGLQALATRLIGNKIAPKQQEAAQNEAAQNAAVSVSSAPVESMTIADMMVRFSNRLLWRLLRLFKDICWMFRLPKSQKRGGVFSSNEWWCEKYHCSEATLRRWRKALIDYGLIASLGSGPNPLFAPLLSPRKVLSFLPGFKRLFAGVLSGSALSHLDKVPASCSTESVLNSNKTAADAESETLPASAEPSLSLEQELVVVKILDATEGQMTHSVAVHLLQTCGEDHVQSALDTLRWHRKAGKPLSSLGGFFRSCVQGLENKTWVLNSAVVAMVEAERREAEYAVQIAEEKLREEARREAQEIQRAEARAAAELAKKQAEAQRLDAIPDALRAPWEAALAVLQTHPRVNRPGFVAHIQRLIPVEYLCDDASGTRHVVIETPSGKSALPWLETKLIAFQEVLGAGLACDPSQIDVRFVVQKGKT